MKIARLKDTKEPIEAEELKFIDVENMPEFICPDENCAVPLVPASFKSHNKQSHSSGDLINYDRISAFYFLEYI